MRHLHGQFKRMRAQGGAGTFPEKTALFTTASCFSTRDPISRNSACSAAAPRGAVDSGQRTIDVNTPYGVIYLSQPFKRLWQTGMSMIMLASSHSLLVQSRCGVDDVDPEVAKQYVPLSVGEVITLPARSAESRQLFILCWLRQFIHGIGSKGTSSSSANHCCLSVASHASAVTARQLTSSLQFYVQDSFDNLVYKYKHSNIRISGNHEQY